MDLYFNDVQMVLYRPTVMIVHTITLYLNSILMRSIIGVAACESIWICKAELFILSCDKMPYATHQTTSVD